MGWGASYDGANGSADCLRRNSGDAVRRRSGFRVRRRYPSANGSESTLSKLKGMHGRVNRFQQSWPEGSVDAKGGVDDLFGYGALGHGGFLWSLAKPPRRQERSAGAGIRLRA